MKTKDARLEEMEFLARLARSEDMVHTENRHPKDTHRRRMIAHLIVDGYLNDIGSVIWNPGQKAVHEGRNRLQLVLEEQRTETISRLLTGQPIKVSIGHKGRVRLAELEQQMKTGRDRDEFGILLAGRYQERDLSIALLSASESAPVAVAFLDMNGLKAINDSRGHEVGDRAIKAFFHAVIAGIEGVGEAYRVGGDEVVVVMPGQQLQDARNRMRSILTHLRGAKVDDIGHLSCAIGLIVVSDPNDSASLVRDRADKIQYAAKAASKVDGRPSALKVGDEDVETLP